MWKESLPKNYLTFRTFIMGVHGNDEIFPNKMLYKGCYDNVPQAFRGETGAQDSIIPATDSVLGLDYPKNQLTSYLWELRNYRPFAHQDYVNGLARQS
jgi:indoleamine 2,3-dioxygenase